MYICISITTHIIIYRNIYERIIGYCGFFSSRKHIFKILSENFYAKQIHTVQSLNSRAIKKQSNYKIFENYQHILVSVKESCQ